LNQNYEDLVAIARRWFALWQGGDLSAFNEIHHPEFIDHSPSGRAPNRNGFRQRIEDLYRAFPDFQAQIEDLLVDLKKQSVSIRWRASGTHWGEFFDLRPTGRGIAFTGIEIIKIHQQQVMTRWGQWDGLDLKEQLAPAKPADKSLPRHILTILAVEDLETAAKFYQRAFGWPIRVEVPVYVEFGLPDGRGFGVYQREGYAHNTGQLPATLPAHAISATEIYLHCENLELSIKQLKEAGARELSALAERDWGDQAAYFADPDGNVIVVARPLDQAN